ncbi:MAG: HAMP domain-containing histidine kinase [Lachnospiraceae bacterium]|nr:HAMP domain-containing histidine kinase [Lachnospiraceae bacterium]
MKRNPLLKKAYRWFVIICPLVIIVLFVIQIVWTSRFNSREHTVIGDERDKPVYMHIAGRGDSTSVWLKRGYMLDGKSVDLTGETIDGTLYNKSSDVVDDWKLRINIKGDCFINNAWCGTVCIHQFTGTYNERVQTLDLRNYDLDSVVLEYSYDGDLLIPLKAGDYIEYVPSVKDSEIPREPGTELTMGMIFYYLDSLDLSDYQLDHSYYRSMFTGNLFYLIAGLSVFWILNAVIYLVSVRIYEEAQRELNLKTSGISCMSDMYNTIYIVDLLKDRIVSVVAEEESDLNRPENMGANDQLKNLFEIDADDAYRKMVLRFTDLTTIRDRMEGKKNIACEYVSKERGWCRLRFFAMDYEEGQTLDSVIFTIQVIEAEKKEIDAAEKKISMAEAQKREVSAFLGNVSYELLSPVEQVAELEQQIIDESGEEKIREYAGAAKQLSAIHRELLKNVIEYSDFEAGRIVYSEGEYVLKDILDRPVEKMLDILDMEKISFSKELPKDLLCSLSGDSVHLTEVITIMLFNAATHIEEGNVKLSVYSKEHDDNLHLLISVKDDGPVNPAVPGKIRLKLAEKLVSLMGSELHVINDEDAGNEVYFETDQKMRRG